MRNMLRFMVVSALAVLLSLSAAVAQTPEASVLNVTEPLDVGGTILQPGTYTIRVLPSFADRNKIQVTSPDLNTVYATVLTVPHPLEPGEEVPATTFVYYPAGEGTPRALRTWFAPRPDASQGGHDIVYDETRAKQLARATNSRVVSYTTGTAMADLDRTELHVVTPEATVETYTYVAPMTSASPAATTMESTTAPVQIAQATETRSTSVEMPETASNLPLIGLLGLLSLAGAFAIRRFRAE